MDFAISRNSPDREIFFPGTGNFFGTRENRVPLISLLINALIQQLYCLNILRAHTHTQTRRLTDTHRDRDAETDNYLTTSAEVDILKLILRITVSSTTQVVTSVIKTAKWV